MISNKQRKIFYKLHKILKYYKFKDTNKDRDKIISFITDLENKNKITIFIRNLGKTAFAYKKSFNEKELLINNKYVNINNNLKKNIEDFSKLFYLKSYIISKGLSYNYANLYSWCEYNESHFINNYKIYEGISFLQNEFKNKKSILEFENIENELKTFSSIINLYMKRYDINM